MSGPDIIEGLKQAARGGINRVSFFEGDKKQVWTRHDVDSPEGLLSTARDTIADLQTETDMQSAEISRLRSLLSLLIEKAEPVVKFAQVIHREPDCSWVLHWRADDGTMTIVTHGDLRALSEAVSKVKEGK